MLEHRADPVGQLCNPGVPQLTSASLVGLAGWHRLEEPLRWLLEHGGGDVRRIMAGVGRDGDDYGALDMALMGSRRDDGAGEEKCPAPTMLCLLEHGANPRGLMPGIRKRYRCLRHGNDCATPILEGLVRAHLAALKLGTEMVEREPFIGVGDLMGPEPASKTAWIDDAIDYALVHMRDPVPAFLALAKIRPSHAHPVRHPLVQCIHLVVRLYSMPKAFHPKGKPALLRCFRLAVSRLREDPSVLEAVPHGYNALARWVVTGEDNLAAADVRHHMFKLLLEKTRVHPDEAVGSQPSPLWIEAQNVIMHGTRDLRCIGELLRRGADPLWSWDDHGEGYPRDAPVLEMLIRVLVISGDGGYIDRGCNWRDWIWCCLKGLKWAMTPCQVGVMELLGEVW